MGTKKFESPSKSVLPDKVYNKIRAKLFDHSILPGQRVNIDALAKELKVSQTPIRESLASLEADGLVVQQPLKGYIATHLLSLDEFRDLFTFRLVIEPWAAAEAAKQISKSEIALLKSELIKGKEALKLSGNQRIEAFTAHDSRFHSLIAEISGNKNLSLALERTHCHLHLYRLYLAASGDLDIQPRGSGFIEDLFDNYYKGGPRNLAFTEHKAIADAICSGDHLLSRKTMSAHINNSLKRFTSPHSKL